MKPTPANAAFEQIMEPEIEAVRILLEGPDRKVFVFCVAMEPTTDGDQSAVMWRSISSGTTPTQGAAYLTALEREIDRVKKIIGKGG